MVNKIRGILQVAAVKAPGYGDRRKAILGDIAILTGANPIFKDRGIDLENVKITDLGRAKKVRISSEETVIVSGAGKKEEIDARVAQIRLEIENTESDYDREKLQERLAKLAAVLLKSMSERATETEMKERKDLLVDAKALRPPPWWTVSIAGGGVALLRAEKPSPNSMALKGTTKRRA